MGAGHLLYYLFTHRDPEGFGVMRPARIGEWFRDVEWTKYAVLPWQLRLRLRELAADGFVVAPDAADARSQFGADGYYRIAISEEIEHETDGVNHVFRLGAVRYEVKIPPLELERLGEDGEPAPFV